MVNPVVGGLLLAFGLGSALRPYRFARFEERLDAIGSERSWSEVEPADWKVTVTRVSGVVVALFGLLVFLDV
ncbi:hypothetical protein [Natronomonas marina]|jgi:hypothetical protein|uniref:hypothetical protein n=1 Tax=Natronomonas marina TaxID=2961939 RepID=UPI0020CA2502|nr:hypothetical protein [Natronomonas marina]